MKCSICHAPISHKESCSAIPLNGGRCCPACDDLIVTPVRIARANVIGHRFKISIPACAKAVEQQTAQDSEPHTNGRAAHTRL